MVIAREKLILPGKPGVYHCVSRVVRRAWLLGDDPLTGKNYDHRREWVRSRLIELTRCFAIEVCGYSVMANHTHLVLKTRPDLAREWDDQETAERWLSLFPKKAREYGHPAKEHDQVVELMAQEIDLTSQIRERLASISWFMRCLNETLARRANREDKCSGRFWEGRFKSTALLDESAILSCMVYVDLNPIRAGVAETPEASDYTSAQDRIVARQARKHLIEVKSARQESPEILGKPTARQTEMVRIAAAMGKKDAWLSPFKDELHQHGKGFLNLYLDDYLVLLDWTGREARADKRGVIPPGINDILDRLEIESEQWMQTVLAFGSTFYRVAGTVKSILTATKRVGQKWLRGKPKAKAVFG